MKLESHINAVILSANDVIANILVVDVDEEGYAPRSLAQVSLPNSTRNYRTKAGEKSLFQRGDLITVKCSISQHKKGAFKEEAVEEISGLFIDQEGDEDTWDALEKRFENEKKFAEEWKQIEKEGRCLIDDESLRKEHEKLLGAKKDE